MAHRQTVDTVHEIKAAPVEELPAGRDSMTLLPKTPDKNRRRQSKLDGQTLARSKGLRHAAELSGLGIDMFLVDSMPRWASVP